MDYLLIGLVIGVIFHFYQKKKNTLVHHLEEAMKILQNEGRLSPDVISLFDKICNKVNPKDILLPGLTQRISEKNKKN